MHANHPARDIPSIAGDVRAIETTIDPSRGAVSPAVATRVALDSLHRGYVMGRHDAIRELQTVADVAEALGIGPSRVRRLAVSRNVGWQVSRGTWLFTPADVDAMRERRDGRPRQL